MYNLVSLVHVYYKCERAAIGSITFSFIVLPENNMFEFEVYYISMRTNTLRIFQ